MYLKKVGLFTRVMASVEAAGGDANRTDDDSGGSDSAPDLGPLDERPLKERLSKAKRKRAKSSWVEADYRPSLTEFEVEKRFPGWVRENMELVITKAVVLCYEHHKAVPTVSTAMGIYEYFVKKASKIALRACYHETYIHADKIPARGSTDDYRVSLQLNYQLETLRLHITPLKSKPVPPMVIQVMQSVLPNSARIAARKHNVPAAWSKGYLDHVLPFFCVFSRTKAVDSSLSDATVGSSSAVESASVAGSSRAVASSSGAAMSTDLYGLPLNMEQKFTFQLRDQSELQGYLNSAWPVSASMPVSYAGFRPPGPSDLIDPNGRVIPIGPLSSADMKAFKSYQSLLFTLDLPGIDEVVKELEEILGERGFVHNPTDGCNPKAPPPAGRDLLLRSLWESLRLGKGGSALLRANHTTTELAHVYAAYAAHLGFSDTGRFTLTMEDLEELSPALAKRVRALADLIYRSLRVLYKDEEVNGVQVPKECTAADISVLGSYPSYPGVPTPFVPDPNCLVTVVPPGGGEMAVVPGSATESSAQPVTQPSSTEEESLSSASLSSFVEGDSPVTGVDDGSLATAGDAFISPVLAKRLRSATATSGSQSVRVPGRAKRIATVRSARPVLAGGSTSASSRGPGSSRGGSSSRAASSAPGVRRRGTAASASTPTSASGSSVPRTLKQWLHIDRGSYLGGQVVVVFRYYGRSYVLL